LDDAFTFHNLWTADIIRYHNHETERQQSNPITERSVDLFKSITADSITERPIWTHPYTGAAGGQARAADPGGGFVLRGTGGVVFFVDWGAAPIE
jgi:hypothetical protein